MTVRIIRVDSASDSGYHIAMVETSLHACRQDERRRGRFRFSLRTMFVLTTAFCVWLDLTIESARRQERAVKAIEAAGGCVGYQQTGPEWVRALVGRHYFDTVIGVSFNQREMKNAGKRIADVAPFLTDLPRLRSLSLGWLEMADVEFGMIASQSNLEVLTCVNMEISNAGAARLSSATRLREIGLNDVIISAQGVAEFKKLPRLEKFWLCCRHTERGPKGELIWNVTKYKLGDEVVTAFLEFPRLRLLDLSFTVISDEGVAVLSRLQQLECFSVNSPRITDAAMKHLVKLKNLTWLGIDGCAIGDESLEEVQQFSKLKTLRLSSAVTNDGLPLIAKLHQVERLELSGKAIDDRGLRHLHGMKNLKSLDVSTTAVTTRGAAVNQLQQALPNCKIRQYYPSPSFR